MAVMPATRPNRLRVVYQSYPRAAKTYEYRVRFCWLRHSNDRGGASALESDAGNAARSGNGAAERPSAACRTYLEGGDDDGQLRVAVEELAVVPQISPGVITTCKPLLAAVLANLRVKVEVATW